jgi:hypothetical protein
MTDDTAGLQFPNKAVQEKRIGHTVRPGRRPPKNRHPRVNRTPAVLRSVYQQRHAKTQIAEALGQRGILLANRSPSEVCADKDR